MNTQYSNLSTSNIDVFGAVISQRLSQGTEDIPHDISERLKAARSQAVARRKILTAPVVTSIAYSGAEGVLQIGGNEDSWWNRIASLVPLIALVAGLISIAVLQDDLRSTELAEVDAELLTDDLPPAAFTDPGFAQYLRVTQTP